MEDYENVPKMQHQIEYLSVAGFFRRLPFAFHMDEINRFGKQVGLTADANHLAYMTAIDGKLGVVRVFPVELMMRVYDVLAIHQSWPPIVEQEPPALSDGKKLTTAAARSFERLAKHLRSVIEIAPNTELQYAAASMVKQIEVELRQLKAKQPAPVVETEPPATVA